MELLNLTKEDFKKAPYLSFMDPPVEFNSLVVMPTSQIHDSDFRCMEFCALLDGKPIAMLGGGSDVFHFDGIGGYGVDRDKVERKEWCFDCLPCGYIRIWCNGYMMRSGSTLSDFEVFAVKKIKEEE